MKRISYAKAIEYFRDTAAGVDMASRINDILNAQGGGHMDVFEMVAAKELIERGEYEQEIAEVIRKHRNKPIEGVGR